jgi:hypothetical protein
MFQTIVRIIILALLMVGCKPSGAPTGSNDYLDNTNDSPGAEITEVIYSLRIPTDIAGFFAETGTGFNPAVPISLEKILTYEQPEHKALLLGVLGVDLHYCSLFERTLETAEYYRHIELLSTSLDLPAGLFESTGNDQKVYLENPDSLNHKVSQVYREMEQHFMKNKGESLSALSLLGGWLEAMYIGVNIYLEHSVVEMGDRILQQKYTLNGMMASLASQQESLFVRRYVLAMDKLRELYDNVEIRYENENFVIDREEQTFHGTIAEINYPPGTLEEISRIIMRLREEMLP